MIELICCELCCSKEVDRGYLKALDLHLHKGLIYLCLSLILLKWEIVFKRISRTKLSLRFALSI